MCRLFILGAPGHLSALVSSYQVLSFRVSRVSSSAYSPMPSGLDVAHACVLSARPLSTQLLRLAR
eukprot:scaffold47116_cov31-Tisochrysis_lutea.AAC.3